MGTLGLRGLRSGCSDVVSMLINVSSYDPRS